MRSPYGDPTGGPGERKLRLHGLRQCRFSQAIDRPKQGSFSAALTWRQKKERIMIDDEQRLDWRRRRNSKRNAKNSPQLPTTAPSARSTYLGDGLVQAQRRRFLIQAKQNGKTSRSVPVDRRGSNTQPAPPIGPLRDSAREEVWFSDLVRILREVNRPCWP